MPTRGWVALALVIGLPLLSHPVAWWPLAVAGWRYTIDLPLAALLTVGLLGWAGFQPGRVRRLAGDRFLAGWWVLFLASALVATGCSAQLPVSLNRFPLLVVNLAVFVVGYAVPAATLGRLTRWWVITAVIVALNGLVRVPFEPEFVSTFGNRNWLAAYLAASVCLAVTLIIGAGQDGMRADRRLGGFALPIMLVGAWLCTSRSAWLALAVVFLGGCGILAYRSSRQRLPRPTSEESETPAPRGDVERLQPAAPASHQRMQSVILVSGVATVGLLLVFGWFDKARLISPETLADRSAIRPTTADVRPLIWSSTWRMILERPVAGHGLGMFVHEYPQYRDPDYFRLAKATTVTDHAHNEPLHITAEQGLIGLVGVLGLWGACFLRAVRRAGFGSAKPGPPTAEPAGFSLSMGFLAAAVVLLVHGLLDVGLRKPPDQHLFWFLLGILAGQGMGSPQRGPADRPVDPLPGGRRSWARWVILPVCLALAAWICVACIYRPFRADLWERQARQAQNRSDWAETVWAAQHALRYEPFRLRMRYLLASALARWDAPGARDEAVRVLESLQELAPDYANVPTNLGALLVGQGRVSEAIPLLERAVEMNPYDKQAQAFLRTARHRFDNQGSSR